MLKDSLKTVILLGMLILKVGCSTSNGNQPCDSSSIISSSDNICLIIEHNGLNNVHQELIESKIMSGISSINRLMSIKDLRIKIVENPQMVIPEIGIGGYNPNDQEVILAIDANFNGLVASLEENLIPQLAHEIHHAKRRRSVGYGNTLLQAVISEGLADHFSIELTGISPPAWTLALTNNELPDWIETASDGWDQSYNHGAWFLGTDSNIPRWTGYSIGFELVKDYLLSNPDRLPSNLHNEEANSFKP